MLTIKRVLKEIDCPFLHLYYDKHQGYYYFEYDDEKNNVFETESVMTYRLNYLSLTQWTSIGKQFVEDVVDKTNNWNSLKDTK